MAPDGWSGTGRGSARTAGPLAPAAGTWLPPSAWAPPAGSESSGAGSRSWPGCGGKALASEAAAAAAGKFVVAAAVAVVVAAAFEVVGAAHELDAGVVLVVRLAAPAVVRHHTFDVAAVSAGAFDAVVAAEL